jgi:hypothetical protein
VVVCSMVLSCGIVLIALSFGAIRDLSLSALKTFSGYDILESSIISGESQSLEVRCWPTRLWACCSLSAGS